MATLNIKNIDKDLLQRLKARANRQHAHEVTQNLSETLAKASLHSILELEGLLSGSRGLTVVEIDRDVSRAAAQLRAQFSLRTPDALQLAAARLSGCSAFITNDRRLPSIDGLRIIH